MPRLIENPARYFAHLLRANQSVPDVAFSTTEGHRIPSIGVAMGQLWRVLALVGAAQRVLELGTARGYSTCFLAEAMRETGGRVLGIDMNPRHCRDARSALREKGLESWCDLCVADARNLPVKDGTFDLVFLDVDQRYYTALEPVCHGALRRGGLLVVDNTAFVDARGLNALVADARRWTSVQIFGHWPGHAPEEDGICLAVRR